MGVGRERILLGEGGILSGGGNPSAPRPGTGWHYRGSTIDRIETGSPGITEACFTDETVLHRWYSRASAL